MPDRTSTPAELAGQLTAAVDDFCDYIAMLPAEALAPAAGVDWGPRETLAHLVFWHEEYARITGALSRGETPALLTASFKELNANAARRERETPAPALLRRFRAAQKSLAATASRPGAGRIVFSFRVGSMRRPITVALAAITRHVQAHGRILRRRGFRPVKSANSLGGKQ